MSGHSKWANIKRKKEVNDKVRGSIFSKLSRLITLAVLDGGGITDPEHNVKLRIVIEKAKASNMPKENIQRAIEKGIGPNKTLLKEVLYEAFAPGGVVLIILATTDNPNRTLPEIRRVLERGGAKLGVQGSVSYLFQKCGLITFEKKNTTQNVVLSFSEKIGAIDIDEDQDHFYVYMPFENLGKVKGGEMDFKPISKIRIDEEPKARRLLLLIETLEELDDVQKVFGNFDMPESLIHKISLSL